MGRRYKIYTYRSCANGGKEEKSREPFPLGSKKCASYTGSKTYTCSGNRDVDMNRNLTFQNYSSGSVIQHDNINPFIERINKEIDERKLNGLYNNYPKGNNLSSVNTGDTILEEQPNSIADLLIKLNKYILNIQDYKFT